MSENMNDDLQKFEDIEALLSTEEKGAHDDEKGAPSVFMTDIRFKEAVETGDLLDEEAYASLDPEDQKGYEMVNVLNDETKESMGWMFRFKADDEEDAGEDTEEEAAEEEAAEEEAAEEEDAEEEAVEANPVEAEASEVKEKADELKADEVKEKAASIMMRMAPPEEEKKPSIFLTDTRFKEMEEDEELISEEKYGDLDMDAKESYEEVDVFDVETIN